jgi:hypothetical protein
MKQNRIRLNFTGAGVSLNLARLSYPSTFQKVDMRNKTFYDVASIDDTLILYVGTTNRTTTFANITWSATPVGVTV